MKYWGYFPTGLPTYLFLNQKFILNKQHIRPLSLHFLHLLLATSSCRIRPRLLRPPTVFRATLIQRAAAAAPYDSNQTGLAEPPPSTLFTHSKFKEYKRKSGCRSTSTPILPLLLSLLSPSSHKSFNHIADRNYFCPLLSLLICLNFQFPFSFFLCVKCPLCASPPKPHPSSPSRPPLFPSHLFMFSPTPHLACLAYC